MTVPGVHTINYCPCPKKYSNNPAAVSPDFTKQIQRKRDIISNVFIYF